MTCKSPSTFWKKLSESSLRNEHQMTLLVLYREEDRTGERGEVKSGPRKKVTYQCFRALHNLKKKLPSSLSSLEVAKIGIRTIGSREFCFVRSNPTTHFYIAFGTFSINNVNVVQIHFFLHCSEGTHFLL